MTGGRALLAGAAALAIAATAGCRAAPPGLSDADLSLLAHVALDETSLHYRQDELDRAAVVDLLDDVAGVRSDVRAYLDVPVPRAEVVLYEAPGPPGAGGHHVRETLVLFDGRRLRFRYPYDEGPEAREQLLGTVAHEVGEASVLAQVTVIDPYLRWLHDGIAELVEHEVMRTRARADARTALLDALAYVGEARAAGTTCIDLTRWRQLAPWLVRSHRFFAGEDNLSLEDLPASRARVRSALATASDALSRSGLEDLERVLVAAGAVEARPWREGEAQPDDPRLRDYLFYVASFAVWLDLERRAPGTARRVVQALGERRGQDDHVITQPEAHALVAAAAGGEAPLRVAALPLEAVEAVLAAEAQRLR